MRLRITKRVVERLDPPATGQIRVQDDQIPGFALVVYESGKRSFVLRYGPKRRRRQIVLGPFPALSVEDARALARTRQGEILRGADPLEEKSAARSTPTVTDWCDEYLEAVKRRKKRPDHDELYLGDVKGRWGSRLLTAVSRRDVEHAMEAMGKRGNTTANRWLASVRACFQAALRSSLIPKNPAMGIKLFREAPARARVLSDEELSAVVDAVASLDDPTLRAAFVLLLDTGARRSEVLRAKWEDFDLEAGTWRLPSPKSNRPQMIPLSPETVRYLKTVPRVTAWVVPGRRLDKPRESLTGPWNIVKAKAELEGVTIHDLRRTFGLHVARTAGLHVASKLLRHSNVQITERVYAPLGLDDLRKALVQTQRKRGKVLKLQRRKGTKR